MKKYKIIIIIFLMLGCAACDLMETNYSNLTADAFFNKEKNAEMGVIAIYQNLNRIYRIFDFGMPRLAFLPSPYATTRNTGFLNYSQFTVNSGDAQLRNLWQDFYQSINRANQVIEIIPGIEMPEDKKASLLAEAKFLRALDYFYLVRFFGAIPFSTEPTTSDKNAFKEFATIEQVYAGIMDDLKPAVIDALPKVREGNEKGRVSQAAAKMLAAKVYLTMAGNPLKDASHLQEARDLLKDLLENRVDYNTGLLPKYKDVFDANNELNEEIIFAIQCDAKVEGNATSLCFTNAPLQGMSSGNGQAMWVVTEKWYNQFEPQDKRRDIIVNSYHNGKTGAIINWGSPVYNKNNVKGLVPWKYHDPAATISNDGSSDYIILRFGDAILMLGEVENELNGPTAQAIELINEVLERANTTLLNNNSDPDGNAWTKESLREFIFQERFRELCFEFQEIFDIRRFGKTQWAVENSPDCQAKGITYDPSMELYPIPITEMNARD